MGNWNDGISAFSVPYAKTVVRPTAVGKKNWLFIGGAQAGQRSAIIYTVVESCRRRGLDPLAYLRDVLSRLPNLTNRQIPEVLPAAWAKTQQLKQRAIIGVVA